MEMNCRILWTLFFAIANNAFAQTTATEFAYITKGYQIQMESGLDMKRGYATEDITEFKVEYSSGNYRMVKFLWLIRNESQEKAGIICIFSYYKMEEDKTLHKYLCFPVNGSDQNVMDMADKEIQDFKDPVNFVILNRAMLKLVSALQ